MPFAAPMLVSFPFSFFLAFLILAFSLSPSLPLSIECRVSASSFHFFLAIRKISFSYCIYFYHHRHAIHIRVLSKRHGVYSHIITSQDNGSLSSCQRPTDTNGLLLDGCCLDSNGETVRPRGKRCQKDGVIAHHGRRLNPHIGHTTHRGRVRSVPYRLSSL